MPISVIGPPASGKSTFLGLLYQEMVRYTNNYKTEFAFYARPDVQTVLGKMNSDMKQGRFPEPNQMGDFSEMSILIGYRPPRVSTDKFTDALKSITDKQQRIYRLYKKMGHILSAYDAPGEEIMYYTKTGVFKDSRLENTFNADIAVFLVDCSIFTRDLEGERLEEQHYYDEQLATLISAFVKYRSENRKLSKKTLYPVFVMTQMDNMDNSIEDRPKIGEGYMWDHDSKEAHEIGNELFSKYLPLSKSVIIGASTMKVVLEENKFFFSWIHMDGRSPEGVQTMESQRIAYRDDLKDPSGYEFKGNVFARGQYLEFIMYLKDICEFTKDSSNLAKKYLDGQKMAQPINQGN